MPRPILLVPAWLRVFDYQDTLVRIVESSAAELRATADAGHRLVLHEFRMLALRYPRESVTYEMNGRVHRVAVIGNDPYLGTPPLWWEGKLLHFRPVQTKAETCQW